MSQDNNEAASALHSAIVNLPCDTSSVKREYHRAYELGHKDARHAAAELVSAAEAASASQSSTAGAVDLLRACRKAVTALAHAADNPLYKDAYEELSAAIAEATTPSAAVAEGVDTALPEPVRMSADQSYLGYTRDHLTTYGAQQREAGRLAGKAESDKWYGIYMNTAGVDALYARIAELEAAALAVSAVPPAKAEGLSDAALDVLSERQRQINAEGWTPLHDDKYRLGELSIAAACYALIDNVHMQTDVPQFWPWSKEWWKPSDERRNLVKAGALILADIERIDRAILAQQAKKGGA